MSNWPSLSRAPIVEGLIDLRIERSETASIDALKTCADELAASFPAKEELRQITGQFGFLLGGDPSFTAQVPSPLGFRLRSADAKWVAQFRFDGFTLSRLDPYNSWEELTTRAKELWSKYVTVIQPTYVVRIATRFINRIPIQQGESFDRTFATTFNIASSLPQSVAGFLLRVVIPFDNETSVAIVTQSLPENNKDCIFDIDVFTAAPEGLRESEIWTKLEQLREIKNRLFFESLTSEAIERFK